MEMTFHFKASINISKKKTNFIMTNLFQIEIIIPVQHCSLKLVTEIANYNCTY